MGGMWRLVLVVAWLMLVTAAPAQGRIERSARAVAEFKRQAPCPITGQVRGACPGYVVDHVVPLACGGRDAPANMQWQTVPDAKAKDRWERQGCERRR
jgi:hypothetical protein